jgi:hypothetical protein
MCNLDVHTLGEYIIGGKLYRRCAHCKKIYYLYVRKQDGLWADEWRELWSYLGGMDDLHKQMDAMDKVDRTVNILNKL